MKNPRQLIFSVFGFLVVLLVGFIVTFVKVPLDKVGVRVNTFTGVIPRDLTAGYYFAIPGIHKIHVLDPTVQAFHMNNDAGSDSPTLQLVGKDQYGTSFDISVLYRIADGKAHRIAQDIGTAQGKLRAVLRSKTERALWDALGRLDTQEFYDVAKREKARADAKALLGQELEPLNLELVDILIRSIDYDPNLEARLVKKQLIDQEREYTIEKTRLERELGKTEAIQRETDAAVRVIQEEKLQEVANTVAETDARINEISADAEIAAQTKIAAADEYRRRKISEGELARTQAKAKGEKAMNDAYRTAGGQAYITRQMVESIDFGKIEINTNEVNPFDVDRLLEMLGLRPDAP